MATDAQGNEMGKLFVGGLHQNTTSDSLKSYFSKFGEIEDAVVMMDHRTGRSRGFGYVKFRKDDVVKSVCQGNKHFIDGKEVDPKPCNVNMKGKNRRSLKIFVGGIAPEQNEDTVRNFFSSYGAVTDVNLMTDPTKQRHRGFAFVGFDNEQVVKDLVQLHYVNLSGKQVEIKAMEPPNPKRSGPNQNGGGRNSHMDHMHNDLGMNGWASQTQWPTGGSWGQGQNWPSAWTAAAQAGMPGLSAAGWADPQNAATAASWPQQWAAAAAAGQAGAAGANPAQWDAAQQTPAWAAAAAHHHQQAQQAAVGQWNQVAVSAGSAAQQWAGGAQWDALIAQNGGGAGAGAGGSTGAGGAAGGSSNQWSVAGGQQAQPTAGYGFSQTPASAGAAGGDWRSTQNSYHAYKR